MNSHSTTQGSADTETIGVPDSPPSFPFAILFLVWLVVAVIATLVTFILPESFSSTARIKIERDQTDVSGMTERGGAVGYDPYFIQTEFELIQSEAVMGKVVEDLDLNKEWGKKYANGDRLKVSESITLLKSRIDLRPVRNTSLIAITVYSDQPREAAKIANAVADAYKTSRLEQRMSLSKGGIKALEERLAEQEGKVKKAQQHVDDLRVKLSISDVVAGGEGPSPLMSADTLRKLEGLRVESQAEYSRQRTFVNQLKGLRQELGPEGLAQAIPTVVPDGVLSAFLERLGAAEQQVVSLTKEFGPQHMEVMKVRSQIEALHSEIRDRADGIVLGLDARVLSLSNHLDNLGREVEKAAANDVAKANQYRPYFEAKRALDELQRFRQILDMKIAGEKIDVELPKSLMVEVVDRAVPGVRPIRPNKPLNILVGIVVGGCGGLFLATLVYVLGRREFRRKSGVPRTQFSPTFRAILHISIALIVGVVVGYHCAHPLDCTTIIVVPLAFLVGGIVSAYIELANPRPIPPSGAAPGHTARVPENIT